MSRTEQRDLLVKEKIREALGRHPGDFQAAAQAVIAWNKTQSFPIAEAVIRKWAWEACQ